MKKIVLLFVCTCVLGFSVRAQLTPGTVAPDFTVTDIDGNSYHLYDLLDQGKTVYLDFFATWCGPCWNYHNGHAFKNLWEAYGPDGTDEAMVFSIEGDPATNSNCLYGSAGCVGGTQGNWVSGTPYPIVEDPSVRVAYSVNYYPTIYIICPADKKVYETGQLSMNGLWNYRNAHCPAMSVNLEVNNVQNVVCFGSNTGSVDITPTNGNPPYTYNWSNNKHTQDLVNVPAGAYSCTVTSSNGWTGVIGPITVEGPPQAMTISVVEQFPVGCNGIMGSLTVEASGGWSDNYSYAWNNGQVGPSAYGLAAGNYVVTATDNSGCTKVMLTNLPPAVYPTASIAAPAPITCAQQTVQLNAGNSSNGPEFNYQWFASNGGNILSGGNTLTPTVNAAGNYTFQITNNTTNCVSYSTAIVTANTVLPNANAGPAAVVSCIQPTAMLEGTGSAGANFTYLWTASNGGSISSGGNTLSPVAAAAGTYTLKVTNTSTGCTQTSSTAVSGQNAPPSVTTTNDTLTCAIANAVLYTTTNALHPTYSWTGPGGYAATVQNPQVGVSGTYQIVVLDTVSGCTNSAIANVTANTNNPGASASGGALTCVLNSVTLNGSSPVNNATYSWTGPNGFASNIQNPSVGAEGQYNLVVTDPANGCTSAASAAVALNNTPPTVSIAPPGNFNCNTNQIQLNGTGSSQGPDFVYLWSTSNGNIVSGGNTLTPLIDQIGSYNLLITNGNTGCTASSATAAAQSPAVTAAIATQNNVSCNGAANGAAAIMPGGGNGAYSYLWSTGAITASVSGLVSGTYLVTVTDGENCTASASVVITQPALLVANAAATAQSANGVANGTATASPTGGVAGYTYLWSNGGDTPTITGLNPGNYSVTVTDANSCTVVQAVTVNSFNCALAASISGSGVTCFGENNGAASVSLLGAADPVAFVWSNGATTPSVADLAPGAYTVSVTDGNDCPALLSFLITEPPVLHSNASSTHESTAGANDGTASANPTGGSGAYTFLWSNAAITQTINNLAPGTYSVTVTDANGCSAIQTVVVNAYNCAIAISASISNVTCAGAANGSISLVPNGGSAPFTYTWNNGAGTPTISSLTGGDYTASILDANGCQFITTASVTEPVPFSPWSVVTENPACPNEPTGTATASITGGTAPYNFVWSDGQTSNAAINLSTGSYGVTVTDQNGCESGTSVLITSSDNVPPAITIQKATIALNSAGIAEVSLPLLSAQYSDNCGVASASVLPNMFDCSQTGEQVVTVTVTDLSGLMTVAVTTVTVIDNTAPVVDCPDNITRCADENTVEYAAPVAADNCLDGGTWNLESGLESGSEFPAGTTTQWYSYTDASGNKGSCSFDVVIAEPAVIGNVSVTHDVNGQGVGSIGISVTGGAAPYTFKWTKDGQSFADTEDLEGLSEGLYSVVVTDANGCVVHSDNILLENTVAVHEPGWLSGVRLQPNPTSGIVRVVFNQAINTSLEINVIDADGRVLISDVSDNRFVVVLDCSALPGGLYFLRFRSGNETGMRKLVVER